ncbi:chymotrypsin-like elastase family member 2A [Dermacentor silvarum]|uniref:chymotrypsin-like elastase family member 2A n=1 Tax=Dermacentor silvarum TaxID=543639 RepID=UPI0021016C9E|nr:chymotrypsin-like elastase family member 2A [Dermacentor silvarum]
MELFAAGCGVSARPPANESRIVGGTPTDIDQWPWQVSLHHRRPSSGAPGRRLCAASLVSASWLLTAAHCLLDPAATDGAGRLLPDWPVVSLPGWPVCAPAPASSARKVPASQLYA